MNVVNLTPHKITIINSERKIVKEFSGLNLLTKEEMAKKLPRVSSSEQIVNTIDGVQVSSVVFGDIVNLPDKQEGVTLIVSGFVLAAAKKLMPERDDLVAPNTGKAFRDADGNVIGVPGFIC